MPSLIFTEPIQEVLLSRPLLNKLEFNLDDHLARVPTARMEFDMLSSKIESSSENTVGTRSAAGTLAARFRRSIKKPPDSSFFIKDASTGRTKNATRTETNENSRLSRTAVDFGSVFYPDEITSYLEANADDAAKEGLRDPELSELRD